MKDQHCNNCRNREGCRIKPNVECKPYIIRTEWQPDATQIEYDRIMELNNEELLQ
jgi:hypothetical protein